MAGGAVVAPDMLQHRPPARPVPAKTHPAPRSTVQAVGDFVPAAQAPGELHAAVPSTRPAAQPVVLAVPSRKDGRSSSGGSPAARSGDDAPGDGGGGAGTQADGGGGGDGAVGGDGGHDGQSEHGGDAGDG
jgi:hypothetical protein